MPQVTRFVDTHNPEVAGSNSARATKETAGQGGCRGIGAPLRFRADHLLRDPLPYVRRLGFDILELERLKWGIVERMVDEARSVMQAVVGGVRQVGDGAP